MTSDAQNKANKSNSEHSTGPITAKGLATSSQNARKHGANAKHLVVSYLITNYKISPSNLVAIGKGKSMLLPDIDATDSRNRRVEIRNVTITKN